MRALFLVGALSLSCISCDWTAFDLEDKAPVLLLTPGKDVRGGFGRSIATQTSDERVLVLVGGAAGSSASSVYNLGTEQKPSVDPSPGTYCDRASAEFVQPCFTSDSIAAIPMTNSRSERDICFAYGWGAAREDKKGQGVVVRCDDSSDITLTVSEGVRSARESRFEKNNDHQPLFLTAEKTFDLEDQVPLVAALPNQKHAWYYPPPVSKGTDPILLRLPEDAERPDSFGAQVAVARLGEDDDAGRLIAVAAPEVGQLWLYRTDEGKQDNPYPVGCLGSRSNFGRTLVSGHVDSDDMDDLVVAEAGVVTVFSGAALAQLPQSYEAACGMGGLPEDAIIASFTCGSQSALAGCDGKPDFGASLAVGDLDGDGDGEVIVGSPGLSAFGEAEAGGVLIYDAEGSSPHELSDALYISSAEARDNLGVSVAAVRQGERDIVVAGAPGNSKTAVFFCNQLLPDDAKTGRCAP